MLKRLVLACSCVTLLSSCAFLPKLHRIDTQQGNVVTQTMMNKLKPHMTKEQVIFVMGNPILENAFNDNQWDYIHLSGRAGEELTQSVVSLYFDADKLVQIRGHLKPNPSE